MYQNFKTLLLMIKQLAAILNKEQKRNCCLVFLFILMGSVFEMLGVGSLLPFLESMLNPDTVMQKWYGRILTNIFGMNDSTILLIFLGIGIVILYLVKNAVVLFSTYVQNKLSARINRELATSMLSSYMKRPYEFFLEHNSADAIRGIDHDINGVYIIISNLFKVTTEILKCITIAILMLLIDFSMAIGIVGLVGFCLFAITFGFKGIMSNMGRKQREASRNCNMHAYQAITGIKEIMVMRRRENFVKRFDAMADLRRKTNLAYYFIIACPNRIIETVCIGGIMSVVCIRIAQGVNMPEFVPHLGTFAVAAFQILPSIGNISAYISGLVFYRPTLEETYDNITAAKEYEKESMGLSLIKGNICFAKDSHVEFKEKIAIENITWKYNNSNKEILKGLSLEIYKGQSVAFIGSSGAGKTTLADIILGLLPPQKGTVKVDGKSIYAIPDEWSKLIGYVPQSVFLIDDTIRNNISFGLLPNEIDEEKVWEALEQAQLAEFVRSLPQGIDTIVGERGVRFSGGQRQRVAIARALYYNPEILVLDEATSALDGETEDAVMESIERLQGKKTLIIVAHRLTTIRNCDKIFEIVDGKAVERKKCEVFGKA